MQSFSLTLPGQIDFGRGSAQSAAEHASQLGDSILLVRSRSAGFADQAVRDLEARGLRVRVIEGRGEPALPDLETHLAALRADPPDGVLAIGGGSVIDLGKALAALLPQPAAPLDYLEVVGAGRALDAAPLPLIALPTTAGTGAEATKNAVIGVPEHSRKVSLRDARMLPRRAIVDPALTDGCPRDVTLASGLDALTQVIEPFLSARANPVTDALCRDAIPRALEALDWLMSEENPAMRDELAYASLMGGIALANAGLGAVHGLAGVIGGRTGMAHGALCGRLLVPVLRANAAALASDRAATERMDWVLRVLANQFGVPKRDALDAAQDWIDAQGLPFIDRPDPDEATRAEWVADAAASSSMKANPVELGTEALMQVVNAACADPRA
ncbi:iron-containing alcohol dehydrogenase [Roseivivax lentus]|nr:iron-containing alcohol dehydrogenase [Roseivivax lentus]